MIPVAATTGVDSEGSVPLVVGTPAATRSAAAGNKAGARATHGEVAGLLPLIVGRRGRREAAAASEGASVNPPLGLPASRDRFVAWLTAPTPRGLR